LLFWGIWCDIATATWNRRMQQRPAASPKQHNA
jgi:hypothetical protein